MKLMKVLVVVAAMLSACMVMVAQSDADYQGWMKTVQANNGKLAKGIAAKDAAAAENANALVGAFKQVEAFWTKRGGAPDAVAFAKTAHESAAAAGKSIAAGDWDKAGSDAKAIGATCGGCHGAHRGGEKGAFTIK